MSTYNREQAEAHLIVQDGLRHFSASTMRVLREQIQAYLHFRADVDAFYGKYFSPTCMDKCFETGESICCGREGITTFFADVVINALVSGGDELKGLLGVLHEQDRSSQCVYLGKQGCRWRVKPIVCAMFLCQPAKEMVLKGRREVGAIWDRLKKEEKRYTWPARPVLFEHLEHVFIKKGYRSDLMYFHNSPGLLRVKAQRKNNKKQAERGA